MSDQIDMRKARDEAAGVITDKYGNRFFCGTELHPHEFVEDGIVYQGDLPPEPEKSPGKKSGERKKRVTFADVQEACKLTAEESGLNLWAVDTNEGIKIVRDQDVVKLFAGEDKKINNVLLWLEGVADTLLNIVPDREVA